MLINKIQPVELRDLTELKPRKSSERLMQRIEAMSPLEALIVSLRAHDKEEYLNLIVEIIEEGMNNHNLNPSLTNAYIFSVFFKKKFVELDKYAAICHEKGIVGFKEAYKWLEANTENRDILEDMYNAYMARVSGR